MLRVPGGVIKLSAPTSSLASIKFDINDSTKNITYLLKVVLVVNLLLDLLKVKLLCVSADELLPELDGLTTAFGVALVVGSFVSKLFNSPTTS